MDTRREFPSTHFSGRVFAKVHSITRLMLAADVPTGLGNACSRPIAVDQVGFLCGSYAVVHIHWGLFNALSYSE